MAGHESIEAHREVKHGSNKSFGLVFAGFFLLIGAWPLVHHAPPRLWAFIFALVFAVLGVFAADVLAPLNRIWFRIGLALNKVVSPVILAVLYFVILVPFAQFMRWRGHDALQLTHSDAKTYWTPREPAAPRRGAMSKQF
jgi:predicted membrane metal-binding protein